MASAVHNVMTHDDDQAFQTEENSKFKSTEYTVFKKITSFRQVNTQLNDSRRVAEY